MFYQDEGSHFQPCNGSQTSTDLSERMSSNCITVADMVALTSLAAQAILPHHAIADILDAYYALFA